MKALRQILAGVAVFLLTSGVALACNLQGVVRCDVTGEGVAGAVLRVTGPGYDQTFTTTDGTYLFQLPELATYVITIDLSGVPGGAVVSPGASQEITMVDWNDISLDFTVTAASCRYAACWLTGGGAKFSALTGTLLAEKGPQISFGGNVNPGCSPTAGDGGQWNHVDHGQKVHFQGLSIQVTDCGNVSEIPPGSTSPVTPYNFIEFKGTGRLNPLAGNKTSYPATVCFTARAEDRNEPGSAGQRDGAYIDRYFIRVTTCGETPETLLFLSKQSVTGLPADANIPVTITDGNLQLHISSCTQ
jgi:hypothetical protein